MRKITRAAAALALAAGALTATTATSASAAQAAGTVHGCPAGAFCIYPKDAGWNGDRPSDVFETYGAHNLSGQVGNHTIFNNQTGGAWARTCTGANGTGDCQGWMAPGDNFVKDLTPINSILLVKP